MWQTPLCLDLSDLPKHWRDGNGGSRVGGRQMTLADGQMQRKKATAERYALHYITQ